MRLRTLATLALLASTATAFAASGYAYGADHCYHFDAPSGWTMDNSAGERDGVPMVFYPIGTTWRSAPAAMYTRPTASALGRPDSVRISEQVNQVIEMYRSNSESIKAKQVRAVRSTAGAAGELRQYTGYSNGGAELVVYYPAPKTLNHFVMQVPQAAAVDQHLPALLELAESYRVATQCKPCSASTACKTEN
jgi:hypothetical protein